MLLQIIFSASITFSIRWSCAKFAFVYITQNTPISTTGNITITMSTEPKIILHNIAVAINVNIQTINSNSYGVTPVLSNPKSIISSFKKLYSLYVFLFSSIFPIARSL